ncbi:hypothetical protein ILYODFUR_033632 [Ilyodon furcidens]|uniref:Uncharacterized protein n=1 Tax=Ilyodon furcidens TaxID=33524 RepID=A0ABV0UDB6_9TELE
MLARTLHLGGPAILGRVWLTGGHGVGAGCVLLPCWPGCGCSPVPGIEDWALCWPLPVGSGVVGRVGHVPFSVWRIVVALGWLVCSFFGVGPHYWSSLRVLPASLDCRKGFPFLWSHGSLSPILFYNLDTLTYNIFMTFTCRAMGVGAVNGIKRECILLTSSLVPALTSKG